MRVRVLRNFRCDVAGVGPVAFKAGQRVKTTDMPPNHRAEKWVENGLAAWPWWWSALACLVLADGAGAPAEGT